MMSDLDQLWVPAAAWIAMIALSALASARLRGNDRVPMQWGVGGRPTWTASPWVAVSFTPILALIVYALTTFGAAQGGRPLVETLVSIRSILSIEGVAFLVVHAAHLSFATRHVAAGRG